MLAAWAVNRNTGEIIGYLEDGSGGGQTDQRFAQILADLDRAIAAINLLAQAAGGGASLGIIAAYGQRLARLYAAVALAILNMDSSNIDPALKRMKAQMSCEVSKALIFGIFSKAGKMAAYAIGFLSALENIQGVTGIGEPLPYACSTE